MTTIRRIKILGWILLAATVAGCAGGPVRAPVVERAPAPAPAPKAPVAEAVPPPPLVAPGYYMVRPADTLYSIALEHGVDYRDVARWNNLDDPAQLHVGQLLRVKPPESDQVQVGAAPGAGEVEAHALDAASLARQGQGDGSTKTSPKALRLPYSKENLAMLEGAGSKPAPQPATPGPAAPEVTTKPAAGSLPSSAKPAQAAAAATAQFIWPAHGKILSRFSESTNKGVDIAGKPGDPVLAAAAGRVMYTGTGIRGYGKLIVIKHDNGFNSVYAHNQDILVKEGQEVSRGQHIADIGSTDSDKPMLHFEIRKSGKPVDPMLYLPPASSS